MLSLNEIPPNYETILTLKQAETLRMQIQGFTYQEMAEEFGISTTAVYYRLADARRRIKGKKRPRRTGALTNREKEVLELRNQGLLYKQIAIKLKISYSTVGVILHYAKGKLDVSK